MTPTSKARNFTRSRWILASIVLLVGLLGGYVAADFFLDAPREDRPKPVAQLIRDLKERDTPVDKVWLDLWSRFHLRGKRLFARFEPKPAAEVRLAACRALGQLRADAAKVVPALIMALIDSDADVQQTAIQALGEMGSMALTAQPELIQLFKNRANGYAALALAKISPDDPHVFRLLKEALPGNQPFVAASPVVEAAVSGLEMMAGTTHEVVPALVSALPGSDVQLRAQIIGALGRIRQQPETVVPILVEALDFDDPNVRRAAIAALGDTGPAAGPAVPELIRLAQDARASRKSKQQSSRKRPSGIDSLSDDQLDSLSEDQLRQFGLLPAPSSIRSGDIIPTLGRIGRAAKEAIPFLVEEYGDQANPLRYEAALVRWQIDGNAEAVAPVFLEGIRQPANRVRLAVIGRLREMGLEAIPILLAAFRDADGNVRLTAVESLVKIKPTLLLDPALLESGINDTHLGVRRTVIQAVGVCGAKAIHAVPLLKPLLNDPKNVIRKVATDALKNIQTANASP